MFIAIYDANQHELLINLNAIACISHSTLHGYRLFLIGEKEQSFITLDENDYKRIREAVKSVFGEVK